MKNIKVIFIHGNGGSTPDGVWFPYVKKELENLGIKVIARQFPDADLAREIYWLPFLKELKADENTILIGHSSGALAAMRYAEKNQIYGSILVGAMHTDLGYETEIISGYYNRPFDWKRIKSNQNWIIQFASTDDPFIPIHEPRFIKDKLNTEYYEFNNQGHFNDQVKFPELLEALKKKI
ncbi:MAG: alpha/beta hydrolase [Candidatus Babeliales bacterium]|nr:alpha/beta hydrolase [Candidatus Babeliales bacterium]